MRSTALEWHILIRRLRDEPRHPITTVPLSNYGGTRGRQLLAKANAVKKEWHMHFKQKGYAYSGELTLPFEEALEHAKQMLAKHGFGTQSEIYISEVLKAKLGVALPREVILGVCNPTLAHRAIQIEPAITLLLPCNVTVKEAGLCTRIEAVSPKQLVGMAGNPRLTEIASEADEKMKTILTEL